MFLYLLGVRIEFVSLLLRLSFIEEENEFPGVNLNDSLVAEDIDILLGIRELERLVSLKVETMLPSLKYLESWTLSNLTIKNLILSFSSAISLSYRSFNCYSIS